MLYYAHSMKIYNTEQEERELQRLQTFFKGEEIYNPNCDEIQNSITPMIKCFDILKSKEITHLVFSHVFRYIPNGVYAEICLTRKLKKPVFILNDKTIAAYFGHPRLVKKDRATRWARV